MDKRLMPIRRAVPQRFGKLFDSVQPGGLVHLQLVVPKLFQVKVLKTER